jgi:hypothetical protein
MPCAWLVIALGRTAQRHSHHDDRQPQTGAGALHHHVTWDLGQDVEREENGQRDIVHNGGTTVDGHAQIRLKTEQLGIADVGAI